MGGATFNLADLFESVVDAVPDRTALATPARTLTYQQLDQRANQLAHHLAGAGIEPGDTVGLQLRNGTEYLEAMLAAFKLRAIPVNVNHRYVERELAHLFDDADLTALVAHASFAERIAAVAPEVGTLRHVVLVVDGAPLPPGFEAEDFESVTGAASTDRPDVERSGDDLYLAYTGGTTGMPKGVVWRHEDLFFAALGGGDPLLDQGPVSEPGELPGRLPDFPVTQLCAPPLMHVSAHWGAFTTFFGGGKVVLLDGAGFDGHEACAAMAEHGVNVLTLVGDAMALPVLDAVAGDPGRHDLSSLFVFASGGALLSPATKARVAELLPAVMVVDAYGSSETGVAGSSAGVGGARFTSDDRTAVLDDDGTPVAPGSGQIGRIARRGHVPLRYHKDVAKTEATFMTVGGERWALPGDMATVDADGTVVLLGRGSGSINTGGEKVFPEEVEAVLKGHPAVRDVLVVGVPDERWGERVAAVVQPDGEPPTLEALTAFARADLAGYKLPRHLVVVDEVRRGLNGKPDYTWAKEAAAAS